MAWRPRRPYFALLPADGLACLLLPVLVSSSGAIVIPPADSPLWDSSPDVSHLRPLPKGLDLPHRGKVFAPARLRQQHEAEEAARQDKPCHDGSMRGYGMGPFRVSSSSLSDLLEKYSLGFLAPSTSSQSAESQAGAGSEFRILPAYQDGTEDFSALYRDMSWNKMESLKDWIEHVKERHAKIIGPHVFGDIQAYSIEQGDTRHAHLTAARVHSMNHRRPGCLWGRCVSDTSNLHRFRKLKPLFFFGSQDLPRSSVP